MRLSSYSTISRPRPQVPGQARRLGCDALLEVAVRRDDERAVIDDRPVSAVPVELGRQAPLGDRHPDGVGEPLAERAGRGLDARRQPVLRMARRDAAPLAERLEVVERHARSRSGAAASTAACWRGRPTGRTGRDPASPGASARGAGSASRRRRPSAPRPSVRPGARSWPAGRRRSRACGWYRPRGGPGRSRRSSVGTPGGHGRWTAIVGPATRDTRPRAPPGPVCSRHAGHPTATSASTRTALAGRRARIDVARARHVPGSSSWATSSWMSSSPRPRRSPSART